MNSGESLTHLTRPCFKILRPQHSTAHSKQESLLFLHSFPLFSSFILICPANSPSP
ncbi:hypothetical protein S83_066272, partial [Arachis hypogaea]